MGGDEILDVGILSCTHADDRVALAMARKRIASLEEEMKVLRKRLKVQEKDMKLVKEETKKVLRQQKGDACELRKAGNDLMLSSTVTSGAVPASMADEPAAVAAASLADTPATVATAPLADVPAAVGAAPPADDEHAAVAAAPPADDEHAAAAASMAGGPAASEVVALPALVEDEDEPIALEAFGFDGIWHQDLI